MRSDRDDDVLDRLYEAAVISDYWPSVFEQLLRRTDAASASFHAARQGTIRWVGTPVADRLISEYQPLARLVPNTRTERGRGRAEFGFVTDLDLYTADELKTEPFYRDFLYPRGYGWFAGTTFEVPSGDVLHFGIERQLKRGPFERQFVIYLDGLRPHLARAALLAARLELQRAKTMTHALEIVGLARRRVERSSPPARRQCIL